MPTLAELTTQLAEASRPVIVLHSAIEAVNEEIAQASIASRDISPSVSARGSLQLDKLLAERRKLAAELAPKEQLVDDLREQVAQADRAERVAVLHHSAIAAGRSARALAQAASDLRNALVDFFDDMAATYRAGRHLGLDLGRETSRARTLADLQWHLDGLLGNSRDTVHPHGDATDQARDILAAVTPLLPSPSETT